MSFCLPDCLSANWPTAYLALFFAEIGHVYGSVSALEFFLSEWLSYHLSHEEGISSHQSNGIRLNRSNGKQSGKWKGEEVEKISRIYVSGRP